MEVIFLGSGTSTGVPMIGCACTTCTSNDPKDNRLRASVLIRFNDGEVDRNVLVDTSTDFRQQSLREGLTRIDAVLFTHPHSDHIHGIDELRSFNFIQKSSIPCYGSPYTLNRIETMFDYIFDNSQAGGGKPKITLHPVEADFSIFGQLVQILPAKHGEMDVYGFRIGNFAYLTDCNYVPDETIKKMAGVSNFVIGAVQLKTHQTHFSLGQAVELAEKVNADKTYITHMNHMLKYSDISKTLPESVFLSYDGLRLTVKS